jgi:hypothetical protein
MGWLDKTPSEIAREAAAKAAKKAGGAAKDAAVRRLTGTHNVKYHCSGTNKHLNGCDGDCHETLADPNSKTPVGKHSHDIHMTREKYAEFQRAGGKAISATREKGGFMVHVTKFPKHWQP